MYSYTGRIQNHSIVITLLLPTGQCRFWLYDNHRGRPRRGNSRSMQQGWNGLSSGQSRCSPTCTKFWSSSDLQDSDEKLISQGFPASQDHWTQQYFTTSIDWSISLKVIRSVILSVCTEIHKD
ncbi:unnamed protein product [Coregonus sp. 'balchen']|nr:unnamed protein product [Coregonus sp. 'balchen']